MAVAAEIGVARVNLTEWLIGWRAQRSIEAGGKALAWFEAVLVGRKTVPKATLETNTQSMEWAVQLETRLQAELKAVEGEPGGPARMQRLLEFEMGRETAPQPKREQTPAERKQERAMWLVVLPWARHADAQHALRLRTMLALSSRGAIPSSEELGAELDCSGSTVRFFLNCKNTRVGSDVERAVGRWLATHYSARLPHSPPPQATKEQKAGLEASSVSLRSSLV